MNKLRKLDGPTITMLIGIALGLIAVAISAQNNLMII
jgi:hypothetical protein